MFRIRQRDSPPPGDSGARVNHWLCTDRFTGKYPHVGLYDCRVRKVWIAKPLAGQAIRTAHARPITGALSVIGFDNCEGRFYRPTIASVDMQFVLAGRRASQLVLEMLANPARQAELAGHVEYIAPVLGPGASTAPAKIMPAQ